MKKTGISNLFVGLLYKQQVSTNKNKNYDQKLL